MPRLRRVSHVEAARLARDRVRARDALARKEAELYGLQGGEPHPVTGRVWGGDNFHTPAAWERRRRRHLVKLASYRARDAGYEFDISYEWLVSAWPSDGHCPVLPHIKLTWGRQDLMTSPSIDRIDSARGYTTDNCRVISYRANQLKSNATVEELRMILRDAENIHGSA